jgi:hypothetical protein
LVTGFNPVALDAAMAVLKGSDFSIYGVSNLCIAFNQSRNTVYTKGMDIKWVWPFRCTDGSPVFFREMACQEIPDGV